MPIDDLKSSIRIYLVLVGAHTPELSSLLIKTPDVIDLLIAGDRDGADADMSLLAFTIVRRLAAHFLQRIELEYSSGRNQQVRDAATVLRVALALSDHAADKSAAGLVRALNTALAAFGKAISKEYPDLEKL